MINIPQNRTTQLAFGDLSYRAQSAVIYKNLRSADKHFIDKLIRCDSRDPEVIAKLVQEAKTRHLLNVCRERKQRGHILIRIAGCNEDLAIAMMEAGSSCYDKKTDGTFTNIRTNCKNLLHVAVSRGYVRLAAYLLERGIDPNSEDAEQNNPLHLIRTVAENPRSALSMAQLLLRHGAKLDITDKNENRVAKNLTSHLGDEADSVLPLFLCKFSPITQPNFHKTMAHSPNVNDMLGEFVNHCLLPVAVLEAGAEIEAFSNQHLAVLRTALLPIARDIILPKLQVQNLQNDYHEQSSLMQALFRPLRLSRTWHHPTITFPRELRPLISPHGREWGSILPSPMTMSNGYTITCLTTGKQLEAESQALNHCVRGYDKTCCLDDYKQRSHILAVRNPSGAPCSTIELQITEPNANNQPPKIRVIQHRGMKNGYPNNQASSAWSEFLSKVESGNITLITDPQKLGETDESRELNPRGVLAYTGCVPSWAHANRCFDEFRMEYRRATLYRPDNRQRVYDDTTSEDGYRHNATHFIDGWAVVDANNIPTGKWALEATSLTPDIATGERLCSLRNVDLKSYLRATGALEKIRNALASIHLNENQKLWQSEHQQPLLPRGIPKPAHKIAAEEREYLEAMGKRVREMETLSGENARRSSNPFHNMDKPSRRVDSAAGSATFLM